ncbi:hypothetical protein FXN63_13345 [Pigmentiphaga aceris]|uniref:DUF2914 domain-containing protein n=1 Tax=Pigmentiphaga aceris TaxID=1940612 RepID=A0A5C0AYE7_9BURK|nr:hypothetical protein [Pigmentiphaga aceris]QEI06706.1 hypothetical protein FXN63_13345 [Pigmentiphaga aceris]
MLPATVSFAALICKTSIKRKGFTMRFAVFFLSLTAAMSLSSQAIATEMNTPTERLELARSVISPNPVPIDKQIPTIEVVRTEFGLFFPPGSTKKKFVSARTVPLVENQMYGWRVYLKPGVGKVRWREEFVLPVAPSTWGGSLPGVTQDVSSDGRTSIKEGTVSGQQGVIWNVWSVAPGDPTGKYVIRVFVEDKLVKTFEFNVE